MSNTPFYTKTETDYKVQDAKTQAYLGIATTTTTPSETGAYWYRVDAPGTYMGVTVTEADFKDAQGNYYDVTLEVNDGVVVKVQREMPNPNIESYEEIPKGYKSANYSHELSLNYSFFDSRCLVNDKSLFKSINAIFSNAGEIRIDAINLDNEIIYSETKTVIAGLNILVFSDLSAVNVPFYVGITCITAPLKTNFPADSEGFSFWKPISSSEFIGLEFRFSYSINVKDDLKSKIESIQIMVYSETTQLQNLINDNRKIGLADKIFEVEAPILIPSGTSIEGVFGRSKLKAKSGFSGDLLFVENAENVRLQNFIIEGNKPNYAYSMNGVDSGANIINTLAEAVSGTYKQNENGLHIKNTESVILDGLMIQNFAGNGLRVNHTGQNYTRGLKASKIFIKDCHTGIFGENEHEYSSYSEMMVTLCQIGQIFSSGNLKISNSIFTRSRFGVIVNKGYNHAHGSVNDSFFKHHQIAGIATNEVDLGHEITACHFDYAKLLINASKGIYFDGRMGFACSVESIGNIGGSNVVNARTMTGIGDLTAGSNTTLNDLVLG